MVAAAGGIELSAKADGEEQGAEDLVYVRTTCAPNCTGGCGQKACVYNGEIKNIIQASDYEDKEHNPRGCLKGLSYSNLIYGPYRMKGPQIRTGAPGSDEFKDVSWEEALDYTGSELRRIIDTYGPESVAVVASGVAIFEDLGEPFHALSMILTPNVASPLFWDVIVLSLCVVLSVAAVILTLKPGSAKHKGDRGYEAQNEETCRKLAYVTFPFTFLLNGVTSLMFATQNTREWWHSALIHVNACAEAAAVGMAFMIVLCVLMTDDRSYAQWEDGIRIMARIATYAVIAYIAMSFLELIPIAWSKTQESQHLLHLVLHTYGPLF